MFKNYGDKDFFDNGILVEQCSNSVYKILVCYKMCGEDDLYYFAHCHVDINDTRIDREMVMNCIGMTEEDFNPLRFAIACVDNYALEIFAIHHDGFIFTRAQIEQKLKHYDISNANLNIT